MIDENPKYGLKKNVVVVEGAANNAIYDLNKGLLYSLNGKTKSFVSQVLNLKTDCVIPELLKDTKEFLLQNDIIEDYCSQNEEYNSRVFSGETERKIDFAWIECTKRCNHKCFHCYGNCVPEERLDISLTDFKRVVNELVDFGIEKVQLIGGEVFLLKEFKEMLSYINKRFSFTSIYTNASLIDQDCTRHLKNCNINKINTTIYSYEEGQHDLVTGVKDSLNKTKNALLLLKDAEIDYKVSTMRFSNIFIGSKNTDLYDLGDTFDFVRLAGKGTIQMIGEKNLKHKLITKKHFRKKLRKNKIISNFAGHNCFINKIYIDTNLEVYPCPMERRISHGNLKDKKLSAIIKTSIQGLNKNFISSCRDCEYRFACFDCRPDSITKNIYDKPWYCTYKPETGEWLDENVFVEELLKSNGV